MMSELIVKEEVETNPAYGSYPHERKIQDNINNGLIILDKPAGPTSHQVTAWVKEILKISKAGHTGTLDPHVTGVLPIMLANAVKIAPAIVGAKKEYVCLMRLHKEVDEGKIYKVAESFIGKIKQIPPRKAAVRRVERKREIYYFEILEIDDKEVLFKVGTEAGTYIRKLCIDFGKALGIGAHMQQLRRTKAGMFTEERAITLHDLKDAYEFWHEEKEEKYLREIIKPMEFALMEIKKIMVKDSAVGAVCYGAPLHLGGIAKFSKGIEENELIAIMSLKGELVALGRAKLNSEALEKKRVGLAAVIQRVIMERDVYPKAWKE